MPTDEQIADYFARSGDSKISDDDIEENEHGFCVWREQDNVFVLINVYGDGRYWEEWSVKKARSLGLKTILFATRRKPDAFIRKYGAEIKGYILTRNI